MGKTVALPPQHLVPPPIHNALMFGGPHAVKYMCIYGCVYVHTCRYICVFICIWMYVRECMFIHVYYNVLYLLIVSVLWILTFEQRMVI